MLELQVKLIELINKGTTAKDMCAKLNISYDELYNNLAQLRAAGFFCKRKYYSNGDIYYKSLFHYNDILELDRPECILYTPHEQETFKVLVISDIHFGSVLFSQTLLDRVFEYCIKNGIHVIFCCGDMIEGNFGRHGRHIQESYKQIEEFIKIYPYDKNIITIGVAGNHDKNALEQYGQDVLEFLRNYRHDIFVPGYKHVGVKIKNDRIGLHHLKTGDSINKSEYGDVLIHLIGHRHEYECLFNDKGVLEVSVPNCSFLNDGLPSVLELNLGFKNGYIETSNIKQIYFGDKDYVISEVSHVLPKREPKKQILYEVEQAAEKVKKKGAKKD